LRSSLSLPRRPRHPKLLGQAEGPPWVSFFFLAFLHCRVPLPEVLQAGWALLPWTAAGDRDFRWAAVYAFFNCSSPFRGATMLVLRDTARLMFSPRFLPLRHSTPTVIVIPLFFQSFFGQASPSVGFPPPLVVDGTRGGRELLPPPRRTRVRMTLGALATEKTASAGLLCPLVPSSFLPQVPPPQDSPVPS